ncbi:MAG TPA: hypothetical protein VKP30_06275 [Polyangiaceae bacterium]|nr:hypothetical protein [Polyangiaceae bacterium]
MKRRATWPCGKGGLVWPRIVIRGMLDMAVISGERLGISERNPTDKRDVPSFEANSTVGLLLNRRP